MQTFFLTRNQMASLLLSLQGKSGKTPLSILQEAWAKSRETDILHGKTFGAFLSTSLPPIFEKLIKAGGSDNGLSLNEIVSLGNQIEYTNFSITSVQNWVKRDIKSLLGSPHMGKKYSIEQAAILFIVEDLKSTLDFDSIRKLLHLVFNDPQNLHDDWISPVQLYSAYSALYEDIDQNDDQVLDVHGHYAGNRNHDHIMEHIMKSKADGYVHTLDHLNKEQQETVSRILVVALVSAQTCYFQALAKRFLNASLFLHDL
ncbi:DUF1836 domain-containing protein [Paenibacillus senegalensis]|uniref:DUF1836 domain-containing protein n=1 Tax=Paenibacillus senegalensis TaxID=1465766 RepID=UPI000289B252|nr:DUF1836 domain-containing protein [Paenibacillus senegalensis]